MDLLQYYGSDDHPFETFIVIIALSISECSESAGETIRQAPSMLFESIYLKLVLENLGGFFAKFDLFGLTTLTDS